MSISFQNFSSIEQINNRERQFTELNQKLPCAFTDDSLFYSRQNCTLQSDNGFPVDPSASTATKNATSTLPSLSDCVDTSRASRATTSNSVSRNATTSTASVCSPASPWSSEQITLDLFKPMTSQFPMCCPQTNPISFILSIDQKDEKDLDNLCYLPPAFILPPSPSSSLPIDLNWIGPSDYPDHSSPLALEGLPDSQEFFKESFIQSRLKAEMPEHQLEPKQATKTIFTEKYFDEQTLDSYDYRPPLEFLDAFQGGEISNKHAPFSYFPEKPRMPITKFTPFVSYRCPFGFRTTPMNQQNSTVCEDTCPNGSKVNAPYRPPSLSTQLTQDVNETNPFVVIDPNTSPFLVAPLRKPPLVVRKFVEPYLRSGFPRRTNLNNPKPSWLIDKSQKGFSKKCMPSKAVKTPFCAKSIVSKLIHAARNKQLSNFNSQQTLAKMPQDVITDRTSPQPRETTARHQTRMGVIETIVLDQSSPRKSTKFTPQPMPESDNVELPQQDFSVWLMKPEIKESCSHVVDSDVTYLVSISPLKPPPSAVTKFSLDRRSKPPVPKSVVDVDVNDEGNLFVTIRLVDSSTPNKSNNIQTRQELESKYRRISANRSGYPGKATCHSSSSITKKSDPYCVKNLVSKFIQAAKSKIISSAPKLNNSAPYNQKI